MASSWILFFSYQDDARSDTNQTCLGCCCTEEEVSDIVISKLRERVYSDFASGTSRNHILTQYVLVMMHVMPPATPSRELCQEEFRLASNLRAMTSSV